MRLVFPLFPFLSCLFSLRLVSVGLFRTLWVILAQVFFTHGVSGVDIKGVSSHVWAC